MRAGKKVLLALIGNQPRAFQQAINEPCKLPVRPPKGGITRDFVVFASNIQLLSKKFATKFLCVKTSSSKVLATSFLYLIVDKLIAGDAHIYLKFALKVTHLFRICQFRQISLNSVTALRASEKGSVISNRSQNIFESHNVLFCSKQSKEFET